MTSACLVITQKPGPPGSGWKYTGASRRRYVNHSCGTPWVNRSRSSRSMSLSCISSPAVSPGFSSPVSLPMSAARPCPGARRATSRAKLWRMDVYEALYTTRAMRRCRPDPIPEDVQARILDAAIRAPSGGNTQNWRFMLVDDPDVRGRLGPIYRDCLALLWSHRLQGPPRSRQRRTRRPRARADAARATVGAAPRRPLRGVPAALVQLRAVRPVRADRSSPPRGRRCSRHAPKASVRRSRRCSSSSSTACSRSSACRRRKAGCSPRA